MLFRSDERLNVVLGDAAEVVAHHHWQGQIDVLHVDLYDHEAAAPVLDDPLFYGHCRRLLTTQGCMVVNLFGRNARYEQSLAHIQQAFGKGHVWAFKPTREGNTVVLAQHQPRPQALAHWHTRAQAIEARWQGHGDRIQHRGQQVQKTDLVVQYPPGQRRGRLWQTHNQRYVRELGSEVVVTVTQIGRAHV